MKGNKTEEDECVERGHMMPEMKENGKNGCQFIIPHQQFVLLKGTVCLSNVL